MISSGNSRDGSGPYKPTVGIPAFEANLARHRRSATVARNHLRDFLQNIPGGAALMGDGQLVLGELVANAVVHARVSPGREIVVRFEVVCDHLRIEVHDASSEKPAIRRATDPDGLSGRGLYLVEVLSLEWGFEPRPEGIGKIVWALVGPEGGVE
ncbi:ATP-binding protein [Kitasatospora sp. NPDC058170]|uniref:ATP-binding protein n=1 Tax=Kitasatospora sp. NPDC058170 TaxID=3346364 RepID=UPI0036DF4F34